MFGTRVVVVQWRVQFDYIHLHIGYGLLLNHLENEEAYVICVEFTSEILNVSSYFLSLAVLVVCVEETLLQ